MSDFERIIDILRTLDTKQKQVVDIASLYVRLKC